MPVRESIQNESEANWKRWQYQAIKKSEQIATKPENVSGRAFYTSGYLDEALTEIEQAVALSEDDPGTYEHLGESCEKQQNLTDAEEAWLHSLELDPSNERLFQRFPEPGMGDPSQEDRIHKPNAAYHGRYSLNRSLRSLLTLHRRMCARSVVMIWGDLSSNSQFR